MPFDEDFLRRGFCFAPEAEGGAEAVETPEPETEAVETPEPAVEPAAEPEPAAEAAPDPSAEVLKRLQAFGLPQDPDGLTARMRQLAAAEQQATQMRAMLWELEQERARRQQAPPAAAQPEKPKLPWELPKFDPRLKQQLIYDEAGNLTVRPGGPPNLVAEYQQYVQAREDALDKLLADPYGVMQQGLAPWIQEEAKKIVAQHLQQTQAQYTEQAFNGQLQNYYQQNKSWMEDPITGQPTAWAQFWGNAIRQARQYNHPNPLQYAEDAIDAQLFRYQQMEAANAETEPAAPANPRLDFLKAKNKPGRGGSTARPNGKKSPAQNSDPFVKLRAELEELHKHNPDDFAEN